MYCGQAGAAKNTAPYVRWGAALYSLLIMWIIENNKIELLYFQDFAACPSSKGARFMLNNLS
jgi:hypothetical protein